MPTFKKSVMLLLTLVFMGCSPAVDESRYEESIEAGLDHFAVEEYSEAETQFKQALEEKEKDEQAEAYLAQTIAYQEALQLFEEEQFDESILQAQNVMDTPNGATSIANRAEALMDEIRGVQEARAQEAAEAEAKAEEERLAAEEEKRAAEQAALEKKEAEQAAEEQAREEAIEAEASETAAGYEYSDFVGYYLQFAPDNPAHSETVLGIAYDQIIVAWWGSEGNTYEVIDSAVYGNTLSVNYSISDPYGEGGGTNGHMELTLNETNGEKTISISFDPHLEFYEASYEEVQAHGYSLVDFVN